VDSSLPSTVELRVSQSRSVGQQGSLGALKSCVSHISKSMHDNHTHLQYAVSRLVAASRHTVDQAKSARLRLMLAIE
jgi:hypothetical protein